jgi:hypothetical protein
MKRYIPRHKIYQLALVLIAIVLITSCEKNKTDYNKKFLGTWISSDLVDTIEFTSDKDFYKRIYNIKDHFDYNSTQDSITIRYNGVLYIYVFPTTHKYQIDGDILTIDFRPNCYGFRNEIISFSKK